MKKNPIKLASTIKDGIESVEWRQKMTSEQVLKTILGFIVATLIMTVAHFIGSSISQAIDRHMKETAEERKKKALEEGGDVSDDEIAFDSRNALASLGGRFIYVIILILGFLVVLRVMGIEIATILAALSTVAVLLGFAIQGTLSDVASGVILAMFQTYEVGDIIRMNDRDGRVIDFRLVNTLLQDMHSMTLVTIPNRVIHDAVVVNYSRSRYHMFSFTIRLAHDNDDFTGLMDKIRKDLRDKNKYPEIFRHRNLDPEVGVYDLSQPATIIRISVPMTPSRDLDQKRNRVRTKVRDLLAKNDIKLWPTR